MKTMIPVAEAHQLILSKIKSMPAKEVNLIEAIGMRLAEDIEIKDSLPPFNRSAMDGYAIRSIDTLDKESVTLKVIEELPAGKVSENVIEPGTCIMLMTGAPIPRGADSVVKRELVEHEDGLAKVPGKIQIGLNVDPVGSDLVAGSTLPKGTLIGPGEAAILASQGYAKVKIHQRPKVAILTTGDELLAIDAPLEPGKIRSSNGYMLYAAIKEFGGEPGIYPALTDNYMDTKEMLIKAGEENDLVLSTGGVSMGNFDFVRKALIEIADEPLFWRLQIKPGMPVVGAIREGTLYLGLSGKPNGALLNFYLMATTAIAKLLGNDNFQLPKIEAKIHDNLPANTSGRNIYLFAKARFNGEWNVSRIGGGQLASLIGYNALIEIPVDSKPLKKGDTINVILLKELTCIGTGN